MVIDEVVSMLDVEQLCRDVVQRAINHAHVLWIMILTVIATNGFVWFILLTSPVIPIYLAIAIGVPMAVYSCVVSGQDIYWTYMVSQAAHANLENTVKQLQILKRAMHLHCISSGLVGVGIITLYNAEECHMEVRQIYDNYYNVYAYIHKGEKPLKLRCIQLRKPIHGDRLLLCATQDECYIKAAAWLTEV